VWNARSRIALDDRQFAEGQTIRLERMNRNIVEYFQEAEHTAALGAQILGNVRGDQTLLRALTIELYRSHRHPAIYGVGVFFAPYAFDGKTEVVNDYVHAGEHAFTPHDRLLPGNVDEVFYAAVRPRASDDYTTEDWYKAAVDSRGAVNVDGPYVEAGRSFISAVKAFYHDGRLAGVVNVDTLTGSFTKFMVSALSQGDIGWIQDGTNGRFLMGTATLPRDMSMRIDSGMRLGVTRAVLHLSSDARPLFAAHRRDTIFAAIVIAAIWILAVIVAALLLARWRAQQERRELQRDQARLESEIAVGKAVATELRKAAYVDALTGLPNRMAFLEHASDVLARGEDAAAYVVLLIDVDRFNLVNETLGHLAGDAFLRAIAGRLEGEATGDDVVFRLGSDKFVVVSPLDPEAKRKKAEHLLAIMAEPLILSGRNLHPRASIGIVRVDPAYAKPHDLLRDAGISVAEAKRRGRGRYVVFDAAMRSQAAKESELEASLRQAIERKEFVPYYQPIVNVRSGAIVSFEALVRWNRPEHGVVTASEFMPFAESHALVHEIDSLVLPQVARDCATLFALFSTATVAVNLSAAELSDRDLADRIAALLAENNVPPSRLKLEITETSMMTPSEEAADNLMRLRESGIELVLDDFGTGYSSLAYLQRLPVVGLKIDRSFVENIERDARIAELVRNIVTLAHTFSLYTVAEGVETTEQLGLLSAMGVDFAQGFLYSPAVALASLPAIGQSVRA
jgi:diguanylate cyclase (GGDEF)-like protein